MYIRTIDQLRNIIISVKNNILVLLDPNLAKELLEAIIQCYV